MRCWATDRSALPFEIRLVCDAKTQFVRIYKEASVCRGSKHGDKDRTLNHFRASLQSCLSVCSQEKLGSRWTDFREILFWNLYLYLTTKFRFCYNRKQMPGTSREDLCTCLMFTNRPMPAAFTAGANSTGHLKQRHQQRHAHAAYNWYHRHSLSKQHRHRSVSLLSLHKSLRMNEASPLWQRPVLPLLCDAWRLWLERWKKERAVNTRIHSLAHTHGSNLHQDRSLLKSFLSISVSKPSFQAGTPTIIFHFPRNPCLRKRKQNKEAVGRAQRLCQYCQLPDKNSLDVRGIPALLSRHLFIRRFLAESLAVCCGTLWIAVRCVINMALDETDDVYFRFLLCKPSSLSAAI